MRDVKNLLDIHTKRGNLVYRRINTQAKIIGKAKTLTPNRDMAGMPDLIVWIKDGPVHCWELKSPVGVQSLNQKKFEVEVGRMGHWYLIIRSLDEAILALKAAGL
jgi:hypothetical protein